MRIFRKRIHVSADMKFMEGKWIHKEDWWYNDMKDGYGELLDLSDSNFTEWLNELCMVHFRR